MDCESVDMAVWSGSEKAVDEKEETEEAEVIAALFVAVENGSFNKTPPEDDESSVMYPKSGSSGSSATGVSCAIRVSATSGVGASGTPPLSAPSRF